MCRFLSTIVGLVGFVVFVFGIVCCLYIVPLLEFQHFSQAEKFENGTSGFRNLFETPRILKFRVYLFTVINSEEVIHNREKAIIKEIGPYVYDVKRFRNLKSIDSERDLFEFTETSYFSFNSEESKGLTDEDVITIVNVFLMGMENLWKQFTFSMTAELFNGVVAIIPGLNEPFARVKVRDLLFDGIHIPCYNTSKTLCDLLKTKHMQMLRISGDDLKLSMFNHLNGTEIGPYVIYVGGDASKNGNLQRYKGKDALDTWSSKGECNTLKGTILYAFPNVATKIYKFFPDLCRSLPLVLGEHSLIKDVPTHTFISTKEPFDAVRENACFCKAERTLKTSLTCNIKGTMSLQDCKHFPLIVSYPHFYLGDVALNNYVDGLAPKKDLHESFAYLEANTGIELSSIIRLQLSIRVKHFKFATNSYNLTEGIFPFLWFEDIHPLQHELYVHFDRKIKFVGSLRVGKYLLVTFGILIMLSAVVLVAVREIYSTRRVPIQRDDFSGRVISEKVELVTANVNLYPQLINRNVSDSFMKSIAD